MFMMITKIYWNHLKKPITLLKVRIMTSYVDIAKKIRGFEGKMSLKFIEQ
jgi:hypothetical protein